MPRQIDAFPRNLSVNHDPTNQIGVTAAQINHLQDQIPAAQAAAQALALNAFLTALDKATGLNLVLWSQQLQALFSQTTADNLLASFQSWLAGLNVSASQAAANWVTLLEELGLPEQTASGLVSWLSGVSQNANGANSLAATALVTSSQGLTNWTTMLASLEHNDVPALSDWLATASANAQDAFKNWVDTFQAFEHQSVDDFTAWLASLNTTTTTNATNLTNTWTQLFGSDSLGVLTTAEQDIANFISNALSGGNAPTSTNSAVAFLDGMLAAIPHGNIVIPPSPGSGSITWDANAFATPFNGPVTSLATVNHNHTCGATANYLVVRLGFYSTYLPIVSVGCNLQSMQLLASETGPDGNTYNQIYGLPNPPTGSALQVSVTLYSPLGSSIYAIAVESDSYIGVGQVGSTAANSGSASGLSLTVPSAAGDYIVQSFMVKGNIGETLSIYNQTSRYNSGGFGPGFGIDTAFVAGDAPGAASVSFTASATAASGAEWAAAAVNLIPLPSTVLGSGFRAANTSTSSVSATSGNNFFPDSFFNSVPTGLPSPDLSYSAASGNTVTIAHAGWYTVTIAVLLVSTFSSQLLGLSLQQNFAAGGGALKRGHTSLISNPGFSTNYVFAHTFQVYCAAGDSLQPAYYCSTSGAAFTGTVDGLSTYFEVSLNNRSLM